MEYTFCLETKRLLLKTAIILDENRMISFSNYKRLGGLSSIKALTGLEYGFMCYAKSNNEHICHCGFDYRNDKVELSYGTEESFRNQGYMSETIPAVISWLFSNTSILEIYARTNDENSHSIKLLEKNNFRIANRSAHEITYVLKRGSTI